MVNFGEIQNFLLQQKNLKKEISILNLTNSPYSAKAILNHHSCNQFHLLFLFSSEKKGTNVVCCQL